MRLEKLRLEKERKERKKQKEKVRGSGCGWWAELAGLL